MECGKERNAYGGRGRKKTLKETGEGTPRAVCRKQRLKGKKKVGMAVVAQTRAWVRWYVNSRRWELASETNHAKKIEPTRKKPKG